GPVGRAVHAQVFGFVAAREVNLVLLAALPDHDPGPVGAGVDGLQADAVQAAGRVVGLALELAAGVQVGQHHLDAGFAGLLVDADGDAVAVVGDGAAAVLVELDGDVVAAPGQGFVHRVG